MGTLMKTKGNFFPAFPTFFDDFLTRDLFDWPSAQRTNGNTLPAVNVMETDNSFELEVAVPGLKKDDFKVELDNDLLLISSEKEFSNEEKDTEGNYTFREFSYQSFKRTFSLPEKLVQGDKITANYMDGILHITIPKSKTAITKPRKVIKIS